MTSKDFAPEATEHRAEGSLDRTIFTVNPETYAEYVARLNASARPNGRLKRTLLTTAPWDEVETLRQL